MNRGEADAGRAPIAPMRPLGQAIDTIQAALTTARTEGTTANVLARQLGLPTVPAYVDVTRFENNVRTLVRTAWGARSGARGWPRAGGWITPI